AALWQEAIKTGQDAAATLTAVAERGFAPDMVFFRAATGAAFFTAEVFPDAFRVAYVDSGPRGAVLSSPAARRVQQDIQSLQFLRSHLCFAFSERQRERFPACLAGSIALLPPFVDAGAFAPAGEPQDGEPLVAVNARGLPPELAREAARLACALTAHGRVALLTENAGHTQDAREMAASLPPPALRRLRIADFLSFQEYRDLLAMAALAVCPPRREAPMSFMLEAMSCEAVLMARAAQANFLRPGVNMLQLPEGGPEAIARAVAQALAPGLPRGRARELAPVARMARRNVLAHFSEDVVAPAHLARVMLAHAAWKKERDRA
ncbi:hypothetical protein, partial [uncultured Desulfovibrio sp.]|uniref:hypothetical protein n=1 Tax=uncultured Desulfovibrio sp. TaxID=167968 RepID=UPI002805F929